MPSITRPGPLRNFTRIVLAILALSGVLALAYRDALTKNWANISVDASESGLEAIELPYSPHEAVQRVTSLVASLPRWMIVTVNGAEGSIQLVHTTRFWRFNDDVRLKFEPMPDDRREPVPGWQSRFRAERQKPQRSALRGAGHDRRGRPGRNTSEVSDGPNTSANPPGWSLFHPARWYFGLPGRSRLTSPD